VRGCFVTGTDTGVGKTVVAGAIVAALRTGGVPVRALKPVLTGLEEPSDPDWPHDHLLLARAAHCDPEAVALRRYDPPVSPHLAAELASRPIDVPALVQEILAAPKGSEALVVEGVGGLLVPLGEGWDVRRLAVAVGLPLVIAARPGLGTINHTLLTLEAARAAGLTVAGVVLTPWPDAPDAIARSNRATIAELGRLPVATLPVIARGEAELLAAAGRSVLATVGI
jgi:dethiobiotin synthetase